MTNLDLREPLPLPQTEDSHVTAFAVTGMTCGHCVAAVTEEVSAIPGVTDVTVDLRPGGTSTLRVTSAQGVTRERIAAALDEAGDYRLTTD